MSPVQGIELLRNKMLATKSNADFLKTMSN